jgi:hypothetical protein
MSTENASIKENEAKVQSHGGDAGPAPSATPFQFPLYKLFLVMAAYAVSFSAFGRGEDGSIIVATWFGTAVAAWVLAVKSKLDLLRTVIVSAGAFLGILVADLLAGPVLSPRALNFHLGLCVCGAVSGAFLFAWTSRITRKE